MKVDIWSDVRCPFCYIGKHKFAAALAQFPQRDSVQVEWHSFELDPAMKTDASININDYLSVSKGVSREQAMQMNRHVCQSAASAGLSIDLDKMLLANSFNAHRLIQLAKSNDLADAAEEALFKAQFVEGKNIDDPDTLFAIGTEIGLDAQEVLGMLSSDLYADKVRKDEAIAATIGINGVPFFVLNNKYGISGAQAPELFLSALRKAWADDPAIQTTE
ncbi:MAG TPA: DsbA family oxidoreductase [Puia sp.]|jgi:predicted DsbA family dithiol-disulfide isomerase|nr:DsbA family oxidoreductase [Puia sp.]